MVRKYSILVTYYELYMLTVASVLQLALYIGIEAISNIDPIWDGNI